MSPGRRRSVAKAQKHDVDIVEVSNDGQLDAFFRLVLETYRKVHAPCLELDVYRNAWRVLGPSGELRISLAVHDGKPVAAMSALLHKRNMLEWYVADTEQGDAVHASSLLVWEMIVWGCANGYELFDFGGAGDPNKKYGVRDFKSRFQGQLVNYGRFIKKYSPVKYSLCYAGYNTIRRVLY